MAITLIRPDGLPQVDAYHPVAVATGSRTIYLAGQVSWDADGATVAPGDLAGQVEQAMLNVAAALAGAGATYDDVVKLTVYVADWTPDQMALFGAGAARAAATLGTTWTPPASLIGVAALDVPEHLVEIEAIAVID